MSKIDEGGRAFPVMGRGLEPNDSFDETQYGMTMRDYFAAKALPACYSDF